jgi:dienelactone hydrolase
MKKARFWAASLPERRLRGKRPERVARLIRPGTPNGSILGGLTWAVVVLAGILAGCVLAGCAGSAHVGAAGQATEPEPEPESTREVQIPSDKLVLAGTLHVPEGLGQRPAVVLLHDTGPLSREAEMTGQLAMQFSCTVDLFEQLADGLQDEGFVVLRYDKRTCGPFNDCGDNEYPFPGLTHVVGDLLTDATAALRWLGKQPEVDPKRVYAVGHGEGGVLVPKLLTDVAELRGGVMLAAPHWSVDRLLEEQVAFLKEVLTAQGMSVDQQNALLAELNQQVTATKGLRAGTYRGGVISGAPSMFWKSLMDLGDQTQALATATPKPLFALSGDYDWNVPKRETEDWGRTFASQDPALHRAKVLPCITHAMTCIEERDPAKIRPRDITCDIDPRVAKEINAFLRQHQ